MRFQLNHDFSEFGLAAQGGNYSPLMFPSPEKQNSQKRQGQHEN